jgi:hypothetical protein
MATVNGKVLFGTADSLPFGTDGRDAPQDPNSHLSSILAIDPSDGSFDIVAIGLRNPQHFEVIDNYHDRHGSSPLLLSFMDIGGVTAEEVNDVSLADLFDTNVEQLQGDRSGSIENFGWGRNADGKAREGTFYIQPGAPGILGTEPPYDSDAVSIPEPGFIQPYAQYNKRVSPLDFVAVTGPVTSKKSFKYEMEMVFADLPSGQVMFTKESDFTAIDVEVFIAKLKIKADGFGDGASGTNGDNSGVSSSGDLNNPFLVDTDLFTLALGVRPDPRFFRFPNGKAGVLLEATGDHYELLELPANKCECRQKKGRQACRNRSRKKGKQHIF